MDGVMTCVKARVWYRAYRRVEDCVRGSMENRVWGTVGDHVVERVAGHVWWRVWWRVGNRVRDLVDRRIS